MNYYPHHIGDFNNATRHLTRVERSLYRDLIDMYFDTEQPLPGDDFDRLARRVLAVTDEEKTALKAVLEEFFTFVDGAWHQSRCQQEIDKYQGVIDNAVKAGKASAAARANKKPTPVERPLNKRATNQEPRTKNQEPVNSVPNGTDGKPSLSPDEIVFGYGVPLLTSAGISDKAARSFLGGLRKGHGDDALINALRDCIRAKPLQPLEWLAKVLPPEATTPKLNAQEALEASNRAVAERFLSKESHAAH